MLHEMLLLPPVYRNDAWLKELFRSAGVEHQRIIDEMMQLYKELFFDTMSERQTAVEEQICDMTPASDLDTRRSLIEARWKTGGKCGVVLLQTICDSWENGRCIVSFDDGMIVITFNGEYGVPNNIDALMTALELARPAHLPIGYRFHYIMVADAERMSVAEMEQITMDQFAFGEEGQNAQVYRKFTVV